MTQVAAIQMNSGLQLAENLASAERLVRQAVEAGAELVVLPEYFYLMGRQDADRIPLGEPFASGPIQDFLAMLAADTGCWILAGTVPLTGPDPEHVYNSSLLFNAEGDCVGRYDKIHLFGFTGEAESYLESATLAPGHQVQSFSTPAGLMRPSVCYDLRFPELYRLAPQPDWIACPAAFTYTTGAAHWEVLLRTRAIENQCYVVAAAQTGTHPSGNRTFGHSMIIDPWGKILDVLPEGDGFVIAEIDLSAMSHIRDRLPALKNRVL